MGLGHVPGRGRTPTSLKLGLCSNCFLMPYIYPCTLSKSFPSPVCRLYYLAQSASLPTSVLAAEDWDLVLCTQVNVRRPPERSFSRHRPNLQDRIVHGYCDGPVASSGRVIILQTAVKSPRHLHADLIV
jgi:hypothetical protein